jgi:NitT/TauT family transport system ATP-binding protein
MTKRLRALDAAIAGRAAGALDALTRRNLQDEVLRIWTEFRKTILFVTRGIEESIHLADRVVVMTYRPGTVKTVVPITIPRPRDTASPGFNALKRHLTGLVREEQRRHEEDEIGKR